MSGTIADREDGAPLSGVVIQNLSREQATTSDSRGAYQIAARKGDSLSFTYLGYYSVRIIMPDDKDVYRRVVLNKKMFSLNEVRIRPGWTPYQLDSIERRNTYRLSLDRKKETSVMSPVSMLAENISRKSRQRWQFQKNFARWESQKFIDTRYTPELVTSLTGLTGDSLAAFINAYPMAEDYARSASDMEIKMWIRYNYRAWVKHPYVPSLPESTDGAPQEKQK